MKTIVMIIGIVLATSSCKPKFKPAVRRVWSWKFSECRCQWYDINQIKATTKLRPCEEFFAKSYPNEPVLKNEQYCDDLIGVSVSDWAKEIKPKANEVIRWVNDRCN